MAVKDFDNPISGEGRPTFKVAGEQFTCRARIPYKRFRVLMNMMRDDVTTEEEATDAFFRAALIKSDRERFFALLNYDPDEADEEERDDTAVLDQSQLNDIIQWLLEGYTGKPEQSGPTSSDGSPSTGQSRKVVSLNAKTA